MSATETAPKPRYKPGQWRARRNHGTGRMEVVRINARGDIYETSPFTYSRWEKAKRDADVWNQMEREELSDMWVEDEAKANGPGAALATLRALAGLTIEEAARRVNAAVPFLKRVESGDVAGTPGFFGYVAGVYAGALQQVGVEPSSCGECDATYIVPVHICERAEVTT